MNTLLLLLLLALAAAAMLALINLAFSASLTRSMWKNPGSVWKPQSRFGQIPNRRDPASRGANCQQDLGVENPILFARSSTQAVPELTEAVCRQMERVLRANIDLQNQVANAKQLYREQKCVADEAIREARVDPLTGLLNRRGLSGAMKASLEKNRRLEGTRLYLLMGDVDRFKQLNDSLGHSAGDQALRAIASAMQESVPGNCVARYGGEEFAAVVEAGSQQELATIAEDLLQAVRKLRLEGRGEDAVLSISLGAAQWSSTESSERVLDRADRALYRAKRAGRNRAHFHTGMEIVPLCVPAKSDANGLTDAEKPTIERRREARFPFEHMEQVAFCDASNPGNFGFQEVSCIDISRTGIAFFINAEPAAKSLLVKIVDSAAPLCLLAELRRSSPLPDGRWSVACEFVRRVRPGDPLLCELPTAAHPSARGSDSPQTACLPLAPNLRGESAVLAHSAESDG